jgi:cysteine desulfurase
MKLPVYLDHHATTPVDERVFDVMRPYFMDAFGNAASTEHTFGLQAFAAVTQARQTIAACLNVEPGEIVFTSGATESNNLAIKGVAAVRGSGHIVTATTEHKAVLDPCHRLAQQGFRVSYLKVDREGFIDLDAVRKALSTDTILVSIMHGNNEIGTVQDIQSIAAICRERGVLFHTDATQTVGKLPFDAHALQPDLVSLSAHKIYGPKGIGALYVSRKCQLAPIIDGGGHERGLRSGTLNVTGIVGLAKALEVALVDRLHDCARTRDFRDRLWTCFQEVVPGVQLNGPDPLRRAEKRLPNNLHLSIPEAASARVGAALTQVAVSSRSACNSGSSQPSHVLEAIGAAVEGCTTLRISTGRHTTSEEIDYVVEQLRATCSVAA